MSVNSSSPSGELRAFIGQYRFFYEVFASPDVLFCELTSALAPFKFEKVDWPGLLEVRVVLFDEDGKPVAHRHRILDGQLLTSTLNLLPLELLREHIAVLKHERRTREERPQ